MRRENGPLAVPGRLSSAAAPSLELGGCRGEQFSFSDDDNELIECDKKLVDEVCDKEPVGKVCSNKPYLSAGEIDALLRNDAVGKLARLAGFDFRGGFAGAASSIATDFRTTQLDDDGAAPSAGAPDIALPNHLDPFPHPSESRPEWVAIRRSIRGSKKRKWFRIRTNVPHACERCHQGSPNPYALAVHRKACPAPEVDYYSVCEYCVKVFTDARDIYDAQRKKRKHLETCSLKPGNSASAVCATGGA